MPLKTDSATLINNIKSRVQQNKSTAPQTQNNTVNNSQIGDIINSEHTTTRNMKISDQVGKLLEKHQIRLNMAKGKVTSGNKNKDKLENARNSLADYARSQYIKEAEKDASMDLSVLDKMKDQDIIDWMTKDDPDAEKAYVDYINKGGFVKDVYNKMMRIDEEALKQQEREESGVIKNFLGSAAGFIGNQIAGASDLLGITDWANNKEKKRLEKYKQANTDEYERYKKGLVSFDELKDKGISGLYNDYEEDVKNGVFSGSVEAYAKALYDKGMEDASRTAQEQTAMDMLDFIGHNPEGEGADAGKKTAEFVEFLTLPAGKMGWLKNTLLGTAEIMGLDILNKGKNNTLGDAAEDTAFTAALTAGVEGLLRVPGAFKRVRNLLGKTSPEVKESLEKTTMNQWKQSTKTASKGLSATKKQASQYINTAAQGIQKRLSGIGEKLGESRDKLVNIGKDKFNYNDLFSSINDAFKSLEQKGWGKGKAPEIVIDDAGNMFIKNEEALSNITDSEGTKILDYLKNEWNAFKNQGRAENAQSVERLMQDIKGKIDKSIQDKKINRGDSTVITIKEGINKAYDKLYKVADELEKGFGKEFREQRKQWNRTKTYEDFFNKYIGSLKSGKVGDKLLGELKDLEKEIEWGEKGIQKGEDVIGKFFKILKKDKVIKEDLGSQLVSLIYAFALKDPKQLQKLIETIYPSIPGVEQFGLDIFRRQAKSSTAKSIIKKGAENRAKQEANNAAYKAAKEATKLNAKEAAEKQAKRDNAGIGGKAWQTIKNAVGLGADIAVDLSALGVDMAKSGIKKSPRSYLYSEVKDINNDL